MDINKEREAFEAWYEQHHNGRQIACDYVEEDNSYSVGYANAIWVGWQAAKKQATPEGFVLVLRGQKYFSHDFNGDGLKYHDTLEEAKKEAEDSLDYYRDRVADGHHVESDGEFNELCFGIVIGSADYSVDDVVTKEHHSNGDYTQYEIGTEILSLFLREEITEEKEEG